MHLEDKTIPEVIDILNSAFGKQDIESLETRFGKNALGYIDLDFAKQIYKLESPTSTLFYFVSHNNIHRTAVYLNPELFTLCASTGKYKVIS